MSVRLPAALSVVCAAFVLPPPLQQPTFRASVEVVRVDVLATSRGVPIEGLTAADFELLDNGVPQVIDAVFAESEALDVYLVFDVSASMAGPALDHLKDAAAGLLNHLRPGDRAQLVTCSHRVRMPVALTDDLDRVRRAVREMPASGATSLLDGIAATVLGRQPDQARAMVLVFSDGLDNRSWLSPEPVLAVVRESDAVVYALAFRVPDPSASIVSVPAASRPDERLLGRLAGATGGRLVVARDSARFEPAFTGILREMRARYLLTYRPRAVAGAGWHTLTVRLKGRAGQVEARAGYLVREASQPPEPHEPETAAALGELPVFGQGFRQCALEEVRDGQDAGSFAQVVPLKPPALDADNGRDIAPLPVRDLASEAIPAELLEQDVFGRMHVQATAFTQVDGQATGDLAPVEGVPPATNRSTLSWVA